MKIHIRYAQAKGGQRMHIVPSMGDGDVAKTALCGKHVEYWRMTCNLPLANCCHNCMRIDRLNGINRAKAILKEELDL
jgi:hypothetical protein